MARLDHAHRNVIVVEMKKSIAQHMEPWSGWATAAENHNAFSAYLINNTKLNLKWAQIHLTTELIGEKKSSGPANPDVFVGDIFITCIWSLGQLNMV